MKPSVRTVLITAACIAVGGFATAAYAQQRGQDQQTPRGWSYEIKQGNCVTIKERSAAGEYKETRQCNPGSNPG